MKHSLTLLTALLLAPLTALHAADAPAPTKPNVLFVVFDDLNNRLGCYGDPVAKSPNLDRLAARGTVFTRNFCQQPICGPSRASFMSGRRPDSLGIWSMTKYLYDRHPDAVTIPQWFMRHGYTAMSIGKVLGGYGKEADFKTLSVPDRRTGGKTKDEFAMPDGAPLPPNLAKDRLCENRDVPDEACFDTVSANLAISELRVLAKKPEPFFLALGLFKPHTPYKIPKRYWDLYRRENIPAIETPARPRNAPDLAFHANHEILGEPNARRTLDDESKRELRHGYYAAMSYADAQFGKSARCARGTEARGQHHHRHHRRQRLSTRRARLLGQDDACLAGTRACRSSSACRPSAKAARRRQPSANSSTFSPRSPNSAACRTPSKLDGISLVPVLKDATATVKTAALTQHPRPALYWGGGPQALPQVMGYGLFTDRWSYHEWRDFRTGHVVGTGTLRRANRPAGNGEPRRHRRGCGADSRASRAAQGFDEGRFAVIPRMLRLITRSWPDNDSETPAMFRLFVGRPRAAHGQALCFGRCGSFLAWVMPLAQREYLSRRHREICDAKGSPTRLASTRLHPACLGNLPIPAVGQPKSRSKL